jgi:peptide/nickel transport system substrate-binding protein
VPKIFTEQDFDMYILGWSLSIFPDYLYDFFAEEQAVLDGNNAGGYVNPEFEAAARALLECEGIDACKEIADELQIISAPSLLTFSSSTPVSSKPTAAHRSSSRGKSS